MKRTLQEESFQPEYFSPVPAFLKPIKALPKNATFPIIKTAFKSIPSENRNPKHMEQIFAALAQELAILLLQNLFPNEQQTIAAHSTPISTPAYAILKQRFSITQANVDSFFTLLENTQETILPPPTPTKKPKKHQEPKNPSKSSRLEQAITWIQRFGRS